MDSFHLQLFPGLHGLELEEGLENWIRESSTVEEDISINVEPDVESYAAKTGSVGRAAQQILDDLDKLDKEDPLASWMENPLSLQVWDRLPLSTPKFPTRITPPPQPLKHHPVTHIPRSVLKYPSVEPQSGVPQDDSPSETSQLSFLEQSSPRSLFEPTSPHSVFEQNSPQSCGDESIASSKALRTNSVEGSNCLVHLSSQPPLLEQLNPTPTAVCPVTQTVTLEEIALPDGEILDEEDAAKVFDDLMKDNGLDLLDDFDISAGMEVFEEMLKEKTEELEVPTSTQIVFVSSPIEPPSAVTSPASSLSSCDDSDPDWRPQSCYTSKNRRSKPYDLAQRSTCHQNLTDAHSAATINHLHHANTPRRRTKMDEEERKARKKLQNKNAATKYRVKKKEEWDAFVREEDELEKKNKALREKYEKMNTEIKYLKGLMKELLKMKGIIK